MWHLLVFAALIGISVGQFEMASMLMGGGGAFGGSSVMNDPVYLCMNTENIRMIPCRDMKDMCDIVALQMNLMPNTLTCAPLGVGCCARDAMSLMLLKRPVS
ncbi:uncharacterized protein LOC127860045 [Dreissena polymorpha]|uniref:Hydrophobin n=1 Tax=Dreissena polymorpha TaxID=45954 RepID=A0A9D3YI26_DREPO|nr:uncharacterized protein LOC127860045 [Dreissena polymorpha]KAH3699189.1 hypothetical protein DPMN_074143 [Dreissena polymorpha]